MDKRELPSDSDESDVDYVPGGAQSDVASEVESDDAVPEEGTDGDEDDGNGEKRPPAKSKAKKRARTQTKRNSGKAKRVRENSPPVEESEPGTTEEEKKEITKEEADAIYKQFLEEPAPKPKPQEKNGSEAEEKVKVTEVYEFAGEKVSVTKDVSIKTQSPAPTRGRGRGRGRGGTSGGLSAVLGQIGKKNKLGTLEKSKLDWEQFKQKEGIENELQTHNRGKDGYLERQDFLERTDLRQYDLERAARLGGRRGNT